MDARTVLPVRSAQKPSRQRDAAAELVAEIGVVDAQAKPWLNPIVSATLP